MQVQEERDNSSTENDSLYGRVKHEGLQLDPEAWKSKGSTTYTSILDLYGAADLFSVENAKLSEERQQRQKKFDEELKAYVFSGVMQKEEDVDEMLIDHLFAEEIVLSKVKTYTSKNENYTISLILAALLTGIVFAIMISRYIRKRGERRSRFAAEINMENSRTEAGR